MQTPLRVQRVGANLAIIFSPEEAEARQVHEGDEVIVLKSADRDRTKFNQALEDVLREHAGTFEYLKDK